MSSERIEACGVGPWPQLRVLNRLGSRRGPLLDTRKRLQLFWRTGQDPNDLVNGHATMLSLKVYAQRFGHAPANLCLGQRVTLR
eukprot:scaffold392_cov177-Amphora_coffeaeformis.AAC.10